MKRIDGPVPLSRSLLLRWQRSFYDAQGTAAFTSGVVPWRITSCPLLAAAYADAAAAFAGAIGGRLQVVELGGGVGRLAFHLMRALEERKVDFHYLYTDASASSVEAARAHPQLAPWADRGHFSVQRLDALDPAELAVPEGPLVVVANYLFDTVPHDAWRAEAGRAIAQHVEVWSPGAEATLDEVEWKFVDAAGAAPPTLEGYAARIGSGRFLWPTGAIACLEAIAARVQRPHLWLVADKGPNDREQIHGQDTATLARHGCVSASVNFDALRAWAGWRLFLGPVHAEMRFGAYALGQGLPRRAIAPVEAAWRATAAANLPLRALEMLEQLALEPANVAHLLQALAFTRFDPDALLRVAAPLRDGLAAQPHGGQLAVVVAALDAVWENHFLLDDPHDLAFEIATVLHRGGQLSHAAGYYRRSLELRGPHATSSFNLALCLLDLGRKSEARVALDQVLAAEPTHPRARALLDATA